MKSELIIDVQPKEVSIAVLEDKRLVELQREKQNVECSVGDIYYGKVKKVMPGLNAAFVDIGQKKEAFIHYNDLGSSFLTAKSFLASYDKYGKDFSPERVKLEKEIETKDGSIADYLEVGDQLMVEITKEAISTKGPRISAELSFAGRNLVLIPFSNKVSISSKILNDEERRRLKTLVSSLKKENVSVIVRTSAEGMKAQELDEELAVLIGRWKSTIANLANRKKNCCLYKETNRTLSLLRDTYNSSFTDIYINDPLMVEETTQYVERIDPGKGGLVKLYDGKTPIFDNFDVTKQIKQLFGKTVTYKSGAYLVIEQTEAMHVIDVNSGNRAKGSTQQEDTAIDVNLAAAEEIARQLRLRDLGGIIVIDFIDMALPANRQALFEKMSECLKNDRANHTVLPLSKFGLMQITRQRVRQAMTIETAETCPTCLGKGKVQPSIFLTDELEKSIHHLVEVEKIKKFDLHLHPFVAAYVLRREGFVGILGPSLFSKWKSKYGKGITITADESLGMLSYEFYDHDRNSLSHFLE